MYNAFYRAPVNTTSGREYYYIYAYSPENTTSNTESQLFIPDSIIFTLVTLLAVNILVAAPANISLLLTIIFERQDLKQSKMIFIAMISAADLIASITHYPVVLSALTSGAVLKTTCWAVGTAYFYIHIMRLWAVGLLGTLTVIKYATKQWPRHERVDKLFINTGPLSIAAFLSYPVIAIATNSIIIGEAGWDRGLSTCQIDFIMLTTVLPSSEKGLSENILCVLFLIVSVIAYFLCLWGSAVYLTYKKVRHCCTAQDTAFSTASPERAVSKKNKNQSDLSSVTCNSVAYDQVRERKHLTFFKLTDSEKTREIPICLNRV